MTSLLPVKSSNIGENILSCLFTHPGDVQTSSNVGGQSSKNRNTTTGEHQKFENFIMFVVQCFAGFALEKFVGGEAG